MGTAVLQVNTASMNAREIPVTSVRQWVMRAPLITQRSVVLSVVISRKGIRKQDSVAICEIDL
jgi:hypothetical protein